MKPLIAIPATIAIVVRAYTHKSLTPTGLILATLTAIIHALHPSPLPFTLLGVFFLLGTAATKVKHDVKATLTLSSSGATGGDGPRHAIQVIANSGVATLLCLGHVLKYGIGDTGRDLCFSGGDAADVLLLGVIANYAAVTADTLSSELGILSRGKPRLITTGRSVPPGTNGGVSLAGLLGGAGGAAVIGFVSVLLLRFCDGSGSPWGRVVALFGGPDVKAWSLGEKLGFWVAVTGWGTLGSLLDSFLGAVLQASVIDKRTGKVVEGTGGKKVLVAGRKAPSGVDAVAKKDGSRSVGSGQDFLDNNQVNVLMALIMSAAGMVVGSQVIGADVSSIFL